MSYDRKIKYLELMEGDTVLQNAGFVKLEVRDGVVSLGIKVEKLKQSDDGAAQVLLLGDGKEAVLGELPLEQGRGYVTYEGLKEEELTEHISYEELQEIRIRLQSDRMLRCIIRAAYKAVNLESEVPLKQETNNLEAAQQVESMEAEETPSPGRGIILDAVEEEPIKQEEFPDAQEPEWERAMLDEESEPTPTHMRTPATTKWQQLWESYPHIKPFQDHREYIELKPQDLVVLTGQCYPLVSNSFLLHGFYNYQHLILTKELVHGQEQYYIGAPGNFYTKEKQVAILFGFESFEGKVEPAQNGDFGYYMIPVEI